MSLENQLEAARRSPPFVAETGLDSGDPYLAAAAHSGAVPPLPAAAGPAFGLRGFTENPYEGVDVRSFAENPYEGFDARSFAENPYEGLDARSFAENPYEGLGARSFAENPYEGLGARSFAENPYEGLVAQSFAENPYERLDARSFAENPYDGLEARGFAQDLYAEFDVAQAAASEYPDAAAFAAGRSGASADRGTTARTPASRPPAHRAPMRRPIKVAFVCSFLYGAGIENWMVGLRQYSDPSAVQFLRCVVTTSLVDERIVRRLGIPVVVGQAEAVRAAAAEADVLLVSGPSQVGEWLANRPRGRVVFVAHGDGQWTRDILLRCRGVIDEVVAVSRRVQHAVGPEFRTTVIHNGIDPAHLVVTEDPALARRRLGFAPDDFVLGYVGRFSPEKNAGALIDAVERLPSGFKLLLVGFGPERQGLMERANRLIPGRYAFTEAHQDLGSLYHAMDAFCLPSLSEGYGLVLMEAMFCGRPVISGPVGFAPEALQNRVNGIVVDGTPEGFAGAARLLRDHPEWRKAVGQEARAFALRYGLAGRMAEKYRLYLSSIVR